MSIQQEESRIPLNSEAGFRALGFGSNNNIIYI